MKNSRVHDNANINICTYFEWKFDFGFSQIVMLIFPIFLNLRRREYIPKLGNVDEIRMNHISTYIIRKEILR